MKITTLVVSLLTLLASAYPSGHCAESIVVSTVRSFSVGKTSSRIASLAFSPEGSTLAAGSGSTASIGSHGAITLLNWRTGSVLKVLDGHGGLVEDIAYSKDGQWLVGGGFKLTIWDARTYKIVKTLPNEGLVHAIAITSDRRNIISAARGLPYAIVWDVEKGKESSRLVAKTLNNQPHQIAAQTVSSLALANDEGILAMGGYEQHASIWNANDWTFRTIIPTNALQTNYIRHVKISHSGKLIFTKGHHNIPGKVYNLDTKELTSELKSDVTLFEEAAFSRRDDLLATVGMEGARIWDPVSGKLLWSRKGEFWSVAFSPDGQKLALGDGNGYILLLNIKLN